VHREWRCRYVASIVSTPAHDRSYVRTLILHRRKPRLAAAFPRQAAANGHFRPGTRAPCKLKTPWLTLPRDVRWPARLRRQNRPPGWRGRTPPAQAAGEAARAETGRVRADAEKMLAGFRADAARDRDELRADLAGAS
jgi:hypothetical protein